MSTMTSYIANHEKKHRIFAKRERELRHALKHSFPQERLLLVAEKLRAAKIGVFKCRFSANNASQPHSFSAEKMAERNEQVRQWLEMSSEEIVNLYRSGAAT